jgi:hypothetical protein
MYGFDTQWYHMPFAVRFAQTGHVWPFNFTAPVFLNWFYPANSELLHATAILAFGRDLLSPVINLGWLAIALLAAWCVGRPWGVSGWSLVGAGVVLGATVFADQPGDARNDVVSLALVLGSGALLANAFAHSSGGPVRAGPALAVAGVAAGLAAGTRLTALAPVAALTVGVIALAPRGDRRRVAAAWLVPVLAAGGLWYLRNLVGSGNPLPWIDSIGPLSLPGPDQPLGGRESFAVIHYATNTGVWSDWFFPALRDRLGLLWPAVLLTSAAGSILAVVRGRGIPRVLGAAAIVGALAYVVTPVTASGPEGIPNGFASNLRYLTAPLALGLALLPVALTLSDRRPAKAWWRWAAATVLAILFVSVVCDSDRWPSVYLKAGIPIGIAAAALAALSIAGYGGRLPRLRRWRLVTVAAGALVAVVVVAVGYRVQRFYLNERYANPAEVLPNPGLATAFKWARGLHDTRIGITIQRQLPFYGTDLSNHVQFVGVHGSAAAFERAASCRAWREAVNAGRYDYVVTAVDRAAPGSTFSPAEEIWTGGDPAAQEIAHNGPATIWKLNGPLDPGACTR